MTRSFNTAFALETMFQIPRVKRDASALTRHADTGNLWVITDGPERLVEFTDQGDFVREVELVGFKDTEGLCHVSGDKFLVAEEPKMRVTLVEIPPGVEKVTDDGARIDLDAKAKKNKGLEGISYDASSDTLYAVREGKPPTVYRIRPLHEDSREQKELPLDLTGLEDLSDLYIDPSDQCLWLLSHESKAAVAFDAKGRRVCELDLRKGRHGLPEDIEQAEGITRDRTGRLLICSEPNRVYCFRDISCSRPTIVP